ncbi:VOC family protein [Rhodopila sp.]|uniref:VOC family protein n=1 Tax=Rhodopila sp. TaxID=2480087 RepID=UPI003D12A2E3
MLVQPYLSFNGRCDEAVKFYQAAIGAEVRMLMRFKDAPDQSIVPPGSADKIMHVSLRMGDSTVMASDGGCSGTSAFSGISLSLGVAEDADADRLFAALADGGQVTMPLAKTFFASKFGMLTDRFGLNWMVMAGQQG